MSKTLLLEIGTEEIPAYAMPGIIAQLKENAEKTFEDLRLSFDSVKTMGTPRRLALLVYGLAENQADLSKENRGPAVNIAFDAAEKIVGREINQDKYFDVVEDILKGAE